MPGGHFGRAGRWRYPQIGPSVRFGQDPLDQAGETWRARCSGRCPGLVLEIGTIAAGSLDGLAGDEPLGGLEMIQPCEGLEHWDASPLSGRAK
ncbi:hypothetical protein NDU88_005263 [Pleurodeles waltl]|uniref:Uncharacterized protein n=1 Tax=Pleurodeles waltl TaxID=8319 RepID=A0AAV7TW38_PLEWA|nr:hypothetical protein NDU88_005263 [Pleurodeles waltl]